MQQYCARDSLSWNDRDDRERCAVWVRFAKHVWLSRPVQATDLRLVEERHRRRSDVRVGPGRSGDGGGDASYCHDWDWHKGRQQAASPGVRAPELFSRGKEECPYVVSKAAV